MITTVDAHDFEPAKRATANGLIDDPQCGHLHRIDDETGFFCGELAGHRVHGGIDVVVYVIEEDKN